MSSNQISTTDRSVKIGSTLLRSMLGKYHPRDFAVRFWDGTVLDAEEGEPARFTLVLKHPGALRRMFWPPNELTMAETYIYDDFDIEGDIHAIFPLADYFRDMHWGIGERLRFGKEILSLPSNGHARAGRKPAELTGVMHSRERDKVAVRYHYDVSNDFYALWLDKRMVYSCAYFNNDTDDIDAAQKRKLEYICRKLRLREGENVLDIGCGWGGLIVYAAQHYGVRCHGITLSQPQADLANKRLQEAGLGDRCSAEIRDYRELEGRERYDKMVSVGMFEHVGAPLLPEYFSHAYRLLRPKGVFLNHGIAINSAWPPHRGPSFSDRYVFPDGELLAINTTLQVAESTGFEVRDVESLREHYALTLRHWVKRLEDRHEQARNVTDETTYRIWRLYMSGSAYGFQSGRLNVYQTLLAKPAGGHAGLPLTRGDWYS